MSIGKLKPLGENGALENDTTFEDWVETGYVDERVRYTRHNKHGNRADNKINEVVCQVKGVGDEIGIDPFIKRLFTSSDCLHAPSNPDNIIDTGDTTKAYYDIDFTKIDGEKKLLVANYSTGCEVDIFDIATLTLESENDLSGGLDTTGTQDWYPVAICNDGTYMYVLFEDTDASPETWCVQSYALSNLAQNASWPATGLDLTGTGSFTVTDGKPLIIYAADDKLAVLQSWNTITAGTSAAVGIIDATDGTLDGEGAGGVTLTSSTDARGLCSDGTNVWFGVRDTTGNNVQLVSMPIASPGATGMYSTATGSEDIDDGDKYTGALACAGDQIVMGFEDDTSACRAIVFITDGSTTTEMSASIITSGSDDINEVNNIVFDGLDFWALGVYDTSLGDPNKMVRLDFASGGSRRGVVSDPYRPHDDDVGYTFFDINPDPLNEEGPTGIAISLAHDGRDIWMPWSHAAGITDTSGRILRFPRTLLRR